MKKVMILGAGGMAGHMIYHYLQATQKYEIYPFYHQGGQIQEQIDAVDLVKLREKIMSLSPDIIINAIGILNKQSEEAPLLTAYINTFLPRFLQWIGEKAHSKLITISTDCVFSGKKGDYTETDVKDAEDMYGLSKNFGEIIDTKNLTIRTSIIGPEIKNGTGLFQWFMTQAGEVKGYTQVYWGGVTTLMLAKAIEGAIDEEMTGLYQLTNNQKISKFALLQLIQKVFEKEDVQLVEEGSKVSDKSLKALQNFDGIIVPGYLEMLEALKMWMDSHKELYTHKDH